MRVTFQVADLERGQTALRCAKQIARSTQIPIGFGHFKSIARFFEHRQLRRCLLRWIRTQQDAIRLVLAAADPSAKLMELSQSETLRILDEHHRRVCNINPPPDPRTANQGLGFSAAKTVPV